jgi:hypothetical protein
MRLDERHKPDGGANLHRFYIRSSSFLETFFIVSSFRFGRLNGWKYIAQK